MNPRPTTRPKRDRYDHCMICGEEFWVIGNIIQDDFNEVDGGIMCNLCYNQEVAYLDDHEMEERAIYGSV